VKGHENHFRQDRKKPIRDPWHRVLLLDHKLNALQGSGEANWERDVPAGTDDNMGIELAQFFMTLDQTFDQTYREQDVLEGDERSCQWRGGDGGEGIAGGGDSGAFHAIGYA